VLTFRFVTFCWAVRGEVFLSGLDRWPRNPPVCNLRQLERFSYDGCFWQLPRKLHWIVEYGTSVRHQDRWRD